MINTLKMKQKLFRGKYHLMKRLKLLRLQILIVYMYKLNKQNNEIRIKNYRDSD